MTVRIVSALARPDLADQADDATAGAFPEYNTHGDVAAPRWSRLYAEYPGYQLVLWDDTTGKILGEANTIPCRFDGTVQGLPRSIDEVLATGLPEVGVAPVPTALCALAIAIPSGQENRGQSRLLLEGMRSLAAGHGWAQLIAPVRPNWKARYPQARVHAVPGLQQKAKRRLRVDAALGDAPAPEWAAEMDQVLIRGPLTEADFFHRASRVAGAQKK